MIRCYIESDGGMFLVKAHDTITEKTVTVSIKQTKEIAKRFASELLQLGQVNELESEVRECK